MNGLRTPLSLVKGLGAAKTGTGHWWMQRVTALALIPLALWFCFSVAALPGSDYATVKAWLGSPFVVTVLILTVIATFYHAQLGLQVVIEDYISGHGMRLAAILLVNFLCMIFATVAIVSLLKISLGA
ncbi:MAG TPA: succinate dehydrogenase, hydrophobic membrane anchor protein [Gammaproteobacteria bacterium]|jgi:succinate dehydrogenase, hydrophobic membrane anchor protein|nr:succinate dehydrogenase, hydrophobic membrane anchor protein [Gammaproteobacteria bacterium]